MLVEHLDQFSVLLRSIEKELAIWNLLDIIFFSSAEWKFFMIRGDLGLGRIGNCPGPVKRLKIFMSINSAMIKFIFISVY